MARLGKRILAATELAEREELHPPGKALGLVKELAKAKFDESVELSFKLGIDASKGDQNVRGHVTLPHGSGKEVRVVVFAQGDKAREAEEAGAAEVGGEELVDKIQKGWTDFDVAVAASDMMSHVGKLGPILRARMPNPKSGTVTNDLAKTVKELRAGKAEFRNDRHGNVHTVIGKASFPLEQLAANYLAVVEEILRMKPAASKGRYLRSVTVSSTMGPGIRIDPTQIKDISAGDGAAAASEDSPAPPGGDE